MSTKFGYGLLITFFGMLAALLGVSLYGVAVWTDTFSFGWDFVLIGIGLLLTLIGTAISVVAKITSRNGEDGESVVSKNSHD